MPEWLFWIIGGVIAFEAVEHVVFPLIWTMRRRRRDRTDPLAALAGRRVKVASWSDGRGQVFMGNERWLAQGPPDLTAGEVVVVGGNEGLLLFVDRPDRPGIDGHPPTD
jgi:membrane protein implicated in regulation of membrane protease activity